MITASFLVTDAAPYFRIFKPRQPEPAEALARYHLVRSGREFAA